MEIYSIEIVDNVAYATAIKDSSDSHGLCKGNDFLGTKEECLEYIKIKNITKVYGLK